MTTDLACQVCSTTWTLGMRSLQGRPPTPYSLVLNHSCRSCQQECAYFKHNYHHISTQQTPTPGEALAGSLQKEAELSCQSTRLSDIQTSPALG